MEWTPADCLACVSQPILPTRSVAAWTVKCDETVIISKVRLGLTAHSDRTSSELDFTAKSTFV